MTTVGNMSEECNLTVLYEPGEPPTPPPLLWVALVHCCCVAIFGTLGNGAVVWCVATCTKTRTEVKVLLYTVFVPLLIICLVTRPMVANYLLFLLSCGRRSLPKALPIVSSLLYSVMAQWELASIAVVAIVRVAAVWSAQRHLLSRGAVVALFTCTFAFSLFCGGVVQGFVLLGYVKDPWLRSLTFIYFAISTLLPVLLTGSSYSLMFVVVQRNKRRLVASQQKTGAAGVMDQATRAMLAVFISNLVFGFPHAVYHLLGKQPHYMYVIFHVLFSTHFVVDPLVFLFFNLDHRRCVLRLFSSFIRWVSCRPPAPLQTVSTLHLNATSSSSSSSSSSDQRRNEQVQAAEEGTNSTGMQE